MPKFVDFHCIYRNTEILKLGENKIKRIPKRSVSRLKQLRYLALNDNELKDECFNGKTFSSKNIIEVRHLLLHVNVDFYRKLKKSMPVVSITAYVPHV